MLVFRNYNEILYHTFEDPKYKNFITSNNLPAALDFPAPSRFDTLRCSLALPDTWQDLTPWAEVSPEFDPAMNGVACCDETLYDDCDWLGLRDVWARFGDEVFIRVGAAWQYMNWWRSVRLCSHCGTELEPSETDRGRKCTSCGRVFYAPLSPAVIVAIERKFADGNKLLLAHNSTMPGKRVSVLAGFVEPGETLEMTVAREIREEVGIDVQDIKYFGSQSWPFPSSLMLGFTAQWQSGELQPDQVEIESADWYSRDEVLELAEKNDLPNAASISRRLVDNWLEQQK